MAKMIITSTDARNDDGPPIEAHVEWIDDGALVTVGTVLPGGKIFDRDGNEIQSVSPGFFVNLGESGTDELIDSLIHARKKAFGRRLRPRGGNV